MVRTVLARVDTATNGRYRWESSIKWNQSSFRLWSHSFAVKFYGVHWGGDGTANVTATLLLGLFMPERFALGKFKHIVGLLAPVSVGAHLEVNNEVSNKWNKALHMHEDNLLTVNNGLICIHTVRNSPLRQMNCLPVGDPLQFPRLLLYGKEHCFPLQATQPRNKQKMHLSRSA